jgi:hypothetical protein
MLLQILLMAVVASSSVAEGDKPLTKNSAVTGQSLGEQQVRQPATSQRGKAFRGTVLAAQAVEPAGGKPASPGKGTSGDQQDTGSTTEGNKLLSRVLTQLLFGLVYYLVIVAKYPELKDTQPSSLAVELQKENEVMATCKVSGRNCVLAWCCSAPRAAHTFAAVGVMSYWPSLLLMSLVPCCTLWFVNSKSDLNVKLGGERRGLCMGCLCACCCSCCVIAQDAEALDLTTGVKTGLCGVYDA